MLAGWRSGSAAAVGLALLSACASSAEQPQSQPQPRPAEQPPQPAQAAAPAAPGGATCSSGSEAGPKVGEQDGDFTIIWTRPAPKPINGSCSMAFDLLYATRVGVNRDSLAVDLRVDAHRPEDPENRFRGASATPRLVMSVDGCPVDPPRVLGALSYGKGADGRIVMRRNELPIGDLVLVFEAFGQQHTMLFANDAKGLRTILPEEHKNYRETPGDPARGEEPASGFVTPDCGNGGQQAVQGGAP